jgi:hypothetical protein
MANMALRWESIGPPPGDGTGWTPAMQKEFKRLTKELPGILEKRKTADELDTTRGEAWARDQGTCDQSVALQAEIDALMAEISYCDSIWILLSAANQYATEASCQAKSELLELELRERKRLGAPDGFSIAPALCCLPAWHAARAKIAKMESLGGGDPSYWHHVRERTAKRLEGVQMRLKAESNRLAAAAKAREKQEEDARAIQSRVVDKQCERDLKQDKVDALLISPA